MSRLAGHFRARLTWKVAGAPLKEHKILVRDNTAEVKKLDVQVKKTTKTFQLSTRAIKSEERELVKLDKAIVKSETTIGKLDKSIRKTTLDINKQVRAVEHNRLELNKAVTANQRYTSVNERQIRTLNANVAALQNKINKTGLATAQEKLAEAQLRRTELALERKTFVERKAKIAIQESTLMGLEQTKVEQFKALALERSTRATLLLTKAQQQQAIAEAQAAAASAARAASFARAERQRGAHALERRNAARAGLASGYNVAARTTVLGGGIATGVGAYAAYQSARYETYLSRMEGLLSINRTMVRGWSTDIDTISQTTGESLFEVADAMYYTASAGYRGAAAVDVLKQSTKAAAIGLGETKTVVDLVTSAVNAYGKNVLTATQATDDYVSAIKLGKMEPDKLVRAMGSALPLLSGLGVGHNEATGLFAAMSRTGTDPLKASVQIQQILMSLIKPSVRAQKTLAGYGLSFKQLRESVQEKGLLQTLFMIRDIFSEQNDQLVKLFPRMRGLRGVLDLMGANLETNMWIWEEHQKALGSTDRAFKITTQTVEYQMKVLRSSWEIGWKNMGDALRTETVSVVTILRGLMATFSTLDFAQHGTLLRFVAFGPVLLGTGLAVRGLGFALRPIAGLFRAVGMQTRLAHTLMRGFGLSVRTTKFALIGLKTTMAGLTLGLVFLPEIVSWVGKWVGITDKLTESAFYASQQYDELIDKHVKLDDLRTRPKKIAALQANEESLVSDRKKLLEERKKLYIHNPSRIAFHPRTGFPIQDPLADYREIDIIGREYEQFGGLTKTEEWVERVEGLLAANRLRQAELGVAKYSNLLPKTATTKPFVPETWEEFMEHTYGADWRSRTDLLGAGGKVADPLTYAQFEFYRKHGGRRPELRRMFEVFEKQKQSFIAGDTTVEEFVQGWSDLQSMIGGRAVSLHIGRDDLLSVLKDRFTTLNVSVQESVRMLNAFETAYRTAMGIEGNRVGARPAGMRTVPVRGVSNLTVRPINPDKFKLRMPDGFSEFSIMALKRRLVDVEDDPDLLEFAQRQGVMLMNAFAQGLESADPREGFRNVVKGAVSGAIALGLTALGVHPSIAMAFGNVGGSVVGLIGRKRKPSSSDERPKGVPRTVGEQIYAGVAMPDSDIYRGVGSAPAAVYTGSSMSMATQDRVMEEHRPGSNRKGGGVSVGTMNITVNGSNMNAEQVEMAIQNAMRREFQNAAWQADSGVLS